MEDAFVDAWTTMTLAIRESRGGLGSRLHRADDGLWIAYAQWPDRQTWERSQNAEPAPDPEAAERMRQAVEQSYRPLPLEPWVDRLVACRAEAEADAGHRNRP